MPSFLRGLFETKAVPRNAIPRAVGGSRGGFYTGVVPNSQQWDIDQALNQSYERVIWVYRCIDAIASNSSYVPMVLREYNDVDGMEIEDPQLLRLLNRRPNTYETSQQFRYRLASQLLLSRRGAFIEIVRNREGRPVELHLLPNSSTQPIPDAEKYVSGYKVQTLTQGEVELPPDRVLWIRAKPHPTDTYAQMTPLVSAGIASDTDFFARLYNRNFLANDGRPGMLIAVQGQLMPEDAEEIRRRFSGGPTVAGQTTVIEAEGITATDMSSNPRDVQWQEAVRGSKEDILLAFGVPESVLGNASGRTFDNADAEFEIFWQVTMTPFMDAIGAGFDALTSGGLEDEVYVSHDYSKVDVLQRQERRRHEKALEEYRVGLMTIDEYLKVVGRDQFDVAGSRVLWIPQGSVPIGRNESDTESAAALQPVGMGQPADPSQEAQQGALTGSAEGQVQFGNMMAARALRLAGKQTDPLAEVSDDDDIVDAEVIEESAQEFKEVRKVRTPEGADRYGQPINTVIVRDSVQPKRRISVSKIKPPTRTYAEVTHIGMFDAAERNNWSLEGDGLSVSVNPDEWRSIAKLGGKPEWTITRSDGKPLQFLDAHKLTKKQRNQIEDWAVESGIAENVTAYVYTYYDDEFEEEMSMTFESRKEAEDQAGFDWMSEEEQSDANIEEVDVLRLTEKYRQRGSEIDDTDLIVSVWADQQTELDGVWWDDTLDPSRMSAPRGVIFTSHLDALTHEPRNTKRTTDDDLLKKGYPDKSDQKSDVFDRVIEFKELTDPFASIRVRIEAEFGGAISAWSRRQERTIVERIGGTKVRKGTRHWDGEPGTKTLDATYVVNPSQWADDLVEDIEPLLKTIAEKEALKEARRLNKDGVLARLEADGRASGGRTPLDRLIGGSKYERETFLNGTLDTIKEMIRKSAMRQSERLVDVIAQMDEDGATVDEIKREIQKMIGSRSSWKRGLSTAAATSTMEGSRAAVHAKAGKYVKRVWRTMKDEKVRPTHRSAFGQRRSATNPFRVGQASLMFPGDPTGPIEETANCRCWIEVKIESGR